MRLPADAGKRLLAPLIGVVLTAGLAGCGMIGGGDRLATTEGTPVPAALGPAADYPIVLGDPFTVDGELFTPADTLNYDSVGYAGLDDGAGVTIAHRTLPLPSYAEVTSLDTGKTVLVRVERRGPMAGKNLVSLSAAAAAQLGVGEGAAIRLRRVNPTEPERAELRAGRSAPDRIETPKSLVEVLRRKLPASGAASLRAPAPVQAAASVRATPAPAAPVVPAIAASGPPAAVSAYPLPLLSGPAPVARPVVVARAETAAVTPINPIKAAAPGVAVKPTPKPAPHVDAPAAKGDFVVQAGTFASRANAQALAKILGGHVSRAGALFRVRTGPFATRGQAEAALAKVRAAGYSDARVYTAG